ncbi:MAG: hypothetical protein ABGX16_19660 [Pirellulales bacterium]
MEKILQPAVLMRWRPVLLVVAAFFTSSFSAAHVCQAMTVAEALDEIGYTRLVTLLGDSIPNGAGVAISQVESSDSLGAYFPDENTSLFTAATDPFSESVDFIDGSGGEAEGTTNHSTNIVGGNFYGNQSSLAGGANEVTVYEANDWLSNVLNLANNQEPLAQPFRVQNFSWVGSFPSDSQDRKALRRFDYIIDTNEVTAVVGLGNDTESLPHLLSHSYNALAVGRTDGTHSTGVTQNFYGPGRIKPDLVVPRTTTSAATAMTSSAATLLHEWMADSAELIGTTGSVEIPGARSEVMRALLLAGATKEEIAGGWSHTTTQPLDNHFGAGELNIYNSYLMALGGQFSGSFGEPSNAVGTHGWDYQEVTPGSDRFYNFEVPVGSTAAELSVVLAWNVQVTDSNSGSTFLGSESLANLDLTLYNSTDAFSDLLLDESLSTVDNVEHLYLTDLSPGTYTLQVSTQSAHDYGLAWRLNTLFDVPSADFNEDGLVGGGDFLTWQRNYRSLLDATHTLGDSDGDGDVDVDDLAAFQLAFGPPPVFSGPISGIVSVPEPGAIILALLLAVGLWIWCRRLRTMRLLVR